MGGLDTQPLGYITVHLDAEPQELLSALVFNREKSVKEAGSVACDLYRLATPERHRRNHYASVAGGAPEGRNAQVTRSGRGITRVGSGDQRRPALTSDVHTATACLYSCGAEGAGVHGLLRRLPQRGAHPLQRCGG